MSDNASPTVLSVSIEPKTKADQERLGEGMANQFGEAKLRLIPLSPGDGYQFENKTVGGSVPKEFITPIDQGIQEALTRGILAGYPIDDVRIELYDGSYHDRDSSEMAFKIAGSMAFQDAAKKAKPVLMEPIMRVEVREAG